MFGVFKKLFSRTTNPPPAAPAQEESVPTPAPAPRPATPATPAAPATPPAAARAAAAASEKISLPLKEILSWLPENLAALVLERPAGTFSISTSFAQEQLRTGAVRIPFSQLRKGSPAGTFTHDTSHDDTLIDLPLSLILAAIGPSGLARRTGQKRTSVPDEVVGVFGAKNNKVVITGQGSAPGTAPTTAKPAAAAPSTTKAAPAPPPPMKPELAEEVEEEPISEAVAPRVTAPAPAPVPAPTPLAAPKMTTSIAQAAATPKVATASPLPFATAKPAPMPYVTGRPASAPAPLPPAPVPAVAVAEPVAPPPARVAAPVELAGDNENTVVVTIEAVSAGWPEAVLQEIQQFNLVSESILIPVAKLEPGMKAGRISFTWGDLCGWLSDPLPPSANGKSEVELPLGVVAPVFLTKRRAATPRKVVSVGADVPDLFAGLSKPAEAPAEASIDVAPAEPVAAEVPAASVEPEAQPDLSPQEVVEWILTLPGVAGALLASNDGLLVAGQLPAPLEAETMAAFLPQILMRIGICTEEIRLGTLRSVMLLVGKTPCAMFKAGALCLAVLGHPGKTLPEAALERMAGELAQLNQ